MARTINPEAVAAKRQQILDAAQRLVLTKGYEQMSIQDILDDVRMSSGAFHHYFDSRRALLDAFIERMQHQMEPPLLSVIHDPNLSAIEKLQGFFDTLDRLRTAQKADVVKLLRVWYSDDNAVVRLKVDEAVREQRAPLLTAIVQQGMGEGSFTTAHPAHAGEIILSLLQGMANTHAQLLLAFDQEHDDVRCIEGVVATHAAYMDAIERVLGAPPYSFARADAEAVRVWLAALRAHS
jgi:AcrR family transcriptional regulator